MITVGFFFTISLPKRVVIFSVPEYAKRLSGSLNVKRRIK